MFGFVARRRDICKQPATTPADANNTSITSTGAKFQIWPSFCDSRLVRDFFLPFAVKYRAIFVVAN
jgi:hypothetical protein